MGLLTLANFRTDVESALGEKAIGNTKVDRWINFGYLDLTGAVEFEILSNDEDISTVSAQNYIVAPTNVLNVKFVRNTTNDYMLAWLPKTEYWRRLQATTAAPTHWTRDKLNLLLHPIPNAVFSLKVATQEPPATLDTAATGTVLPDIWDPAVFQLSVHHALLALGQEQRATAWLARAIAYMQSRITEDDYHGMGDGQGASITKGMAALQARLGES